MPQTDPVRLADLTTMRVGGPAQRYLEASTTDELVDAVREVDDADEPLLIVAGGSNLVVADEVLVPQRALVIHRLVVDLRVLAGAVLVTARLVTALRGPLPDVPGRTPTTPLTGHRQWAGQVLPPALARLHLVEPWPAARRWG